MRKFFLSIALAFLVLGSVALSTADAQWRRVPRVYYYPNYGYSSYYYAPEYYAPSYYSPGYSYYYRDPSWYQSRWYWR